MKHKAADTSKYDITGEETTVQMRAIQLRLETKILYLQFCLFLGEVALRCRRIGLHALNLFYDTLLRITDLLLYCDEAYAKGSSHVCAFFSKLRGTKVAETERQTCFHAPSHKTRILITARMAPKGLRPSDALLTEHWRNAGAGAATTTPAQAPILNRPQRLIQIRLEVINMLNPHTQPHRLFADA